MLLGDVAQGQTLNRFAFVTGNPLTKIDPSGQWFWLVIPGLCSGGGCEAIIASIWFGTWWATNNLNNNGIMYNESSQSGSVNWDEVQKKTDHANYHRTCDRLPPPGLTPCEKAKWEYRQAKACHEKRQAWEDRWGDASTREPHTRALANVKRRMANAARDIAIFCSNKQCP
ncbi:MAG: hypothetical protein SVR94_11010 [Pseudomonadota bacterium]|nr:hypothetical protein [Pseudomonadota bacterium]